MYQTHVKMAGIAMTTRITTNARVSEALLDITVKVILVCFVFLRKEQFCLSYCLKIFNLFRDE